MFPTTTTTITRRSSFSAYYSLFISNYSAPTKNYYDGFVGHYYHTLESSVKLPANTKITLIDMSGATTKYYYYIVSSNDYNTNKKVYRFSDFYCMDSEDEHYSADGSYFNSAQDLLFEEYIVQVDFEDTTLAASLDNQNLVVQLRDAYYDTVRLTVNTALYPMLFSVYNNLDVNATLDLSSTKNVIYMGEVLDLEVESNYAYRKNGNNDVVYDTTHIDDQLGVRITISSGSNQLTAANLQGIYIRHGNTNYFVQSDGSFRIKIADAVANVIADMDLHTERGTLGSGTYTIKAESFGSLDGTYFSSAIAEDTINVQVVSTTYGFDVTLPDSAVLINKEDGKNTNNSNNMTFTIGYSGSFSDPTITVSLLRRNYDTEQNYNFDADELSLFVTNTLTSTATAGEYLVTDDAQAEQTLTLTTRTNLKTGTYKVRFKLYDGINYIATMDKAIIVK